jgi:putative glutamate/gamma-aminobutyrate antiporter
MQLSNDKPRRVLSIFILAMLNVSIMASLRNLPLVAEFGLSAIFFFFVVALFFLIPCALISAELATGWPKSGGIYIWVREALGDRWGFTAIWMQWVHNVAWYPVIMSFIAVTMAYLISPSLAENKFFVLAVVLVGFWGMTLLNYLGIKTSGWFSTIGVIIGTLLPGLLIIFLGISWLFSGHPIQTTLSWDALFPSFTNLGNLVFLAGLFLAFAGMEVSASYASDVQNPQRNYPRAIILGAVITFTLFMLGSLAIAIVIPKEEISLVAGLMEAFKAFFQYYYLSWILPLMAFLLVIGAIAEVNSWIIGPVKGLYATSLHGNLPPYFQKVNKHDVPTRLLLFQAVLMSITSLVFLYMPQVSSAFWMLTALSAQSYLIMYILMFIAAIKLRYSKPHVPRAYRVPFKSKGIWLFSCMGIFSSCFAIALCFVPPSNLKVGNPTVYALLLAGGLIIMCTIPLFIHRHRKPHWILHFKAEKESGVKK